MPDFLASYDIDSTEHNNHKAMVDAGASKGWTYVFLAPDGKLNRLPDTTLWGVFADRTVALTAFIEAAKLANKQPKTRFKVEKLALTLFEQRAVASNKKKAPNPLLLGKSNIETCLNHQDKDKFFQY
ncbi:MAG: hypothetical protein JSR24_00230 [Proteobacteria bacterium]|nr:hypothetical protein [Pseudomonadota bacterium]